MLKTSLPLRKIAVDIDRVRLVKGAPYRGRLDAPLFAPQVPGIATSTYVRVSLLLRKRTHRCLLLQHWWLVEGGSHGCIATRIHKSALTALGNVRSWNTSQNLRLLRNKCIGELACPKLCENNHWTANLDAEGSQPMQERRPSAEGRFLSASLYVYLKGPE